MRVLFVVTRAEEVIVRRSTDPRPPEPGIALVRRPEVVRVEMLGGFRVTVGSRVVGEDAWRLRKAAALVKLLALEPIRTRTIRAAGYGALAILFLGAVALAMLALSTPASAAGAAKTTLTIKAQGLDLSGTVQSSRGSCLGDRNVKLYKQKGQEQRPNTDTLVATDTSERQGDHGEWSTGNTGMRGKFYVRTGKVPGCTGATSKTVRAR